MGAIEDEKGFSRASTKVIIPTPSDTAYVVSEANGTNGRFPRGIFIPVSDTGTLRIETMEGDVLNYVDGDLAKGITHPRCVKRIHATGTTLTKTEIHF